MKVKFFGVLSQVVGASEVDYPLQPNLQTLKNALQAQFPALVDYQFQFAVNLVVKDENQLLNDTDEIALLPPFSGG